LEMWKIYSIQVDFRKDRWLQDTLFLRMCWNFISSLPVKRGGSLSFLVGTICNVLVMICLQTEPVYPPTTSLRGV
jgi:hypothetical protein